MNRLKLQVDRLAAELSQDRHTDSPQIFVEDTLVNVMLIESNNWTDTKNVQSHTVQCVY